MHNGFKILNCQKAIEEKQDITVVTSHTMPNSLVYGADWSWDQNDVGVKAADHDSLKAAQQLPAPSPEHTVDHHGEGPARAHSRAALKDPLLPLTEDRKSNSKGSCSPSVKRSGLSRRPSGHSFDSSLLATCSFYDHVLHLWKLETKQT